MIDDDQHQSDDTQFAHRRSLRWSQVDLLVTEAGTGEREPSVRSAEADADADAEDIDAQRLIRYQRLLTSSLLAICTEAAPFLAACLETGLLARAGADGTDLPQTRGPISTAGVQFVAAFSAVSSCCQFTCGLFNFLVSVVMTNVSRTIGAKAWHQVGPRVWLAIATALVCGLLVACILWAARDAVFGLLSLSPALREMASGFFVVSVFTIPAVFLNRVVVGVLGGFGRLNALCAWNVTGSAAEVAAVALVLSTYRPVSGEESDSGRTLQVVGCAIALATILRSMVGVILISLLAPPEVRFFPALLRRSGDVREALLEDQRAAENAFSGNTRPAAPPFRPLAFLRDSANMMVRSLCIQVSVWALCICCSRLDSSGALLCAHHVSLQIWMLTSYIVDGFADVGTVFGAQLLGARRFTCFYTLRNRLAFMGSCTGVASAAFLWGLRDHVIKAFLAHGSDASRAALTGMWPLLSGMQVTNSLVFTYDGLLLAAAQFAFVRNVLLGGMLVFIPALSFAYSHAADGLPLPQPTNSSEPNHALAVFAGPTAWGIRDGKGYSNPFPSVAPQPYVLAGIFGVVDEVEDSHTERGQSDEANGCSYQEALLWVWSAKALLNVWRCCASLWCLHSRLPNQWASAAPLAQ